MDVTITIIGKTATITIEARVVLRAEGNVIRYDIISDPLPAPAHRPIRFGTSQAIAADHIVEQTGMSYTHAMGILAGLEAAAWAVHAADTAVKVGG